VGKALIVYGTEYGAAASTSDEIAGVLRQQGWDVQVVNAKEEKVKSIAEYDLIVVGSGIQIHRWRSAPEAFLKDFRKELGGKRLALFVCCGSAAEAVTQKKPELTEKARKRYLEEKAAKYGLQPVALGLFGGVYNFNKLSWIARKGLEKERPKIAATYKETQPGVYDMRDLGAIRSWARGLAQKARS
jgi:menaquinone-dependent protoporphyrinogen IX oxidase